MFIVQKLLLQIAIFVQFLQNTVVLIGRLYDYTFYRP